MPNWPVVEKCIFDWAVAATGCPASNVRWADQPAPVPARPECILTWIDRDNPVTRRERRLSGSKPGIAINVFNRTHTLQIDYIAKVPTRAADAGAAAAAVLGQALRTLELDSVLQNFRDAGCPFWTISNVRDLTALQQTEYEGRANCDLQINTTDTIDEDVGQVTSVTGLTLPPSTFTPG